MKGGLIAGILALLAFAGTIEEAVARDLRIRYAEPIEIHSENAAGRKRVQQLPREPGAGATNTFTFDAYGRRFVVELENNRRLLSRLSAVQRRSFDKYQLYRGRLQGMAGSWVRLTQVNGELEGAIWDGRDFYAITSARRAAPDLDVPVAAQGSAPVVYRLRDADSAALNKICRTMRPDEDTAAAASPAQSNALTAYKAMIAELESHPALRATAGLRGQIEVAVLGDSQFVALNFPDARAEIISRMNVVDGIYTEQLAVALAVPEVRLFDSASNPFTTNKSEDLLVQLADYRNDERNGLRNRGLVHLMTGRSLDDNTVGIAYMNSLCHPRAGAGLSEASHASTFAALIIAHEIGHNFGAPHDAEPESACASSPLGYIMSPVINNAGNTFSSCSKQQIEPWLAAASCLMPAEVADVAVEVPAATQALSGAIVDYPVDVVSVGTRAVENMTVRIFFNAWFAFESATVTDGSCVSDGSGSVSCELASLPGGATRRINLRLRATGPVGVSTQLTATVSATNDRFTANNEASGSLSIGAAAAVSITINQTSISGRAEQPLDLTATVTSLGPGAVHNVQARFSMNSGIADSATMEGASCVVEFGQAVCTIAMLPAGATRQMQVRFRAMRGGSLTAEMQVESDEDARTGDNYASVPVIIDLVKDVGIELNPAEMVVGAGEVFDYTAALVSRGSGSININNPVLFINASEVIVESMAFAGASCNEPAPGRFVCTTGNLAAGESRNIVFRLRAPQQLLQAGITFRISYSDDEDGSNNLRTALFDVRNPVDVSVASPVISPPVFDTEQLSVSYTIASQGSRAALNVTSTLQVPEGLTVISASIGSTPCTVTARAATCALASLAANSGATVAATLRGDQPGTHAISISASADGDAVSTNNSASGTFQVKPYTDVRVALLSQAFNLHLDDTFTVSVNAITDRQPVNEVRVEIRAPGSTLLEATSTPAGVSCSGNSAYVCTFASLPANSTTRIDLRLRASALASNVNVSASVSAPFDLVASNDSATPVGLNITNVPSPSGGGGGGGGAFDRLLLLILLCCFALSLTSLRRRGNTPSQ